MSESSSYIEIDTASVAKRLKMLRKRRRLDENNLAGQAGLSRRTITDLERARRPRILETTVMNLSRCLEVDPDVLLCRAELDGVVPAGNGRRRRAMVAIGAALVVATVVVGALVLQGARRSAVWEIEGGQIVVRDSLFGGFLWQRDYATNRITCREAPWSDRELLIGAERSAELGGQLHCVDRVSGESLWIAEPDVAKVVMAFGAEDVEAGTFTIREMYPADLDGDGPGEIVARFIHSPYYPTVLIWVDETGNVKGQYAHKGHLRDTAISDIDGDGKDEVIAARTNNSRAYQGATVVILDDEHFSGASVDALTDSWSIVPDSALVRVVIPCFPDPYQSLMRDIRQGAFKLRVLNGADGRSAVSIEVGSSDDGSNRMLVMLDRDLRPIRADIKDRFLENIQADWPDSLKIGTGPGDKSWRQAWLDRHVRFEAGHWPPVLPVDLERPGPLLGE